MTYYYWIDRQVDGEWVHCTSGGKTKEAALKRLKKIAGYAHNRNQTFRLRREA
jgi:hypothetical protein